jgi:hypothetical protein
MSTGKILWTLFYLFGFCYWIYTTISQWKHLKGFQRYIDVLCTVFLDICMVVGIINIWSE